METFLLGAKKVSDWAGRVSVAETVVVPAGTRMITEGETEAASHRLMGVEPLRGKRQEDKFLMTRKIVEGSGTWIPGEVMIPPEEDVILYKHTQVGIITRLPEQSETNSLIEKFRPDKIPRQNSKLYYISLRSQLTKSNKSKFAALEREPRCS